MKAGTFREDLFYRLNVITVTVPPLRERPADLPRLAAGCLRFFAAEAGRPGLRFAPAAEAALRGHAWPGNLRELRNAIERAVILARGDEIEPDDLPVEVAGAARREAAVELGALVPLERLEREHVRRVVARTVTLEEAAQVLGIDAATLYRKRKRWAAEEGGAPAAGTPA